MKGKKDKTHQEKNSGFSDTDSLRFEEEMQTLGYDVHHLHNKREARHKHLNPTSLELKSQENEKEKKGKK